MAHPKNGPVCSHCGREVGKRVSVFPNSQNPDPKHWSQCSQEEKEKKCKIAKKLVCDAAKKDVLRVWTGISII